MKGLGLSKSLQALLLATTSLTAVALLKPDAVEVPVINAVPPRSADGPSESSSDTGAPWVRLEGEEWKPNAPEQDKVAAVPAPAPSRLPPPAPVIPPKPTAPDPALTYLGHMDQDGRSYVFVGRGARPLVVEVGGQVDAQWKVERASASEVELRYLPLDEVRLIAVQ